ncbi:MAG TPA: hypothetical protein VK681_39250 [Reyranella sp.]|nr:hypothetical protein [Reyranella sp.]
MTFDPRTHLLMEMPPFDDRVIDQMKPGQRRHTGGVIYLKSADGSMTIAADAVFGEFLRARYHGPNPFRGQQDMVNQNPRRPWIGPSKFRPRRARRMAGK